MNRDYPIRELLEEKTFLSKHKSERQELIYNEESTKSIEANNIDQLVENTQKEIYDRRHNGIKDLIKEAKDDFLNSIQNLDLS